MNTDKRTVTTDALETLGKIISPNEKRDAIHLAVENVVAGHTLRPGENIGFLEDGTVGHAEHTVGIVDPFLPHAVQKGQRFWLVVYPRQITSLRHVWTHPAFPESELKYENEPDIQHALYDVRHVLSEQWLRNFIENADCPDYDTVIAVASGENLSPPEGYSRDSYNNGEYLFFSGHDAHGDIPSEFWDHLEVVTGKKKLRRATYFSCSC